MWVRVPPSVPKIVVFEKYSNTIFLYQILNRTRKGGLENSPVDYFPDSGCIVPPSVPKIVVFEKYSNTIFLYQILNRTRKGGLENSPVDYFPDTGCTVPPSVPKNSSI